MNDNDAVLDTVLDDGADAPVAAATTVVADAATAGVAKVKGRPGRKLDTTGKTALGAARLLYAANPSLSGKELKALFVEKIGTSPQVAQTYVHIVRKAAKAALSA